MENKWPTLIFDLSYQNLNFVNLKEELSIFIDKHPTLSEPKSNLQLYYGNIINHPDNFYSYLSLKMLFLMSCKYCENDFEEAKKDSQEILQTYHLVDKYSQQEYCSALILHNYDKIYSLFNNKLRINSLNRDYCSIFKLRYFLHYVQGLQSEVENIYLILADTSPDIIYLKNKYILLNPLIQFKTKDNFEQQKSNILKIKCSTGNYFFNFADQKDVVYSSFYTTIKIVDVCGNNEEGLTIMAETCTLNEYENKLIQIYQDYNKILETNFFHIINSNRPDFIKFLFSSNNFLLDLSNFPKSENTETIYEVTFVTFLASMKFNQNMYEESCTLYNKAYNLLDSDNYLKKRIRLLLLIFKCHLFNKDFKGINEFIQEKITIFEKIEDLNDYFEYLVLKAYYLEILGKYENAITILIFCIKFGLKYLNGCILKLSNCFQNLSSCYKKIGNYEEALHFCNLTLQIRKKLLGDESIPYVSSLNELSEIYQLKGEYVKSLQTAEIIKFVLEKIHLITHQEYGQMMHNTGLNLICQGKVKEAIKEYLKCLKLRQEILHSMHLDLAMSYNNLGCAYYSNNENLKSLHYYKKTLFIFKNTLGKNHLNTAILRDNLGDIYRETGKIDKALKYYKDSYKVKKSYLGTDHFLTAVSLMSIAWFYFKDKKDYVKGNKYWKKSIKIKIKCLGFYHPETANAYENKVSVDKDFKFFEKSKENLHKTFIIRENTLGNDNSFKKEEEWYLEIIKDSLKN
jgi:tetratricopeptide (TPR) repeat protein